MKINTIIVMLGAPLLSLLLSLFTDLPWWIFIPISFLFSYVFSLKISTDGFFANFIGTAISWIIAAVIINHRNESILSEKIATLFHLPSLYLLFVISGLLGGLLAGGAGSLGAYLHLLQNQKKKRRR
jgi:hypothetical protein